MNGDLAGFTECLVWLSCWWSQSCE